jgi:hypothetical protein
MSSRPVSSGLLRLSMSMSMTKSTKVTTGALKSRDTTSPSPAKRPSHASRGLPASQRGPRQAIPPGRLQKNACSHLGLEPPPNRALHPTPAPGRDPPHIAEPARGQKTTKPKSCHLDSDKRMCKSSPMLSFLASGLLWRSQSAPARCMAEPATTRENSRSRDPDPVRHGRARGCCAAEATIGQDAAPATARSSPREPCSESGHSM